MFCLEDNKNTCAVFVFITEIIWQLFDVMIDNIWRSRKTTIAVGQLLLF